MSAEENKVLLRRFYDEVFNQGNLAAVDELIADDVVDHNLPPGFPPGLAGAKQLFSMFLQAFPDLQVTIEDLIAEGDKVVAHGLMRGTQQGVLLGMPPTGRQVTIAWMDICRIADGKQVEVWHLEDQLSLLQQLGAIPAPGQ